MMGFQFWGSGMYGVLFSDITPYSTLSRAVISVRIGLVWLFLFINDCTLFTTKSCQYK